VKKRNVCLLVIFVFCGWSVNRFSQTSFDWFGPEMSKDVEIY
jgi:hypothetical protein